jgi:cardiolipin synthase
LSKIKNMKWLAVEQSARGWDTEQIFSSAQGYFDNLVADIEAAQSTIVLAVYIFSLDHLGNKIASALKSAADRGVKVRVVVDGVGSYQDGESLARLLSPYNAEVRIFHPLPWYLNNYKWSIRTGGFLEKFIHFVTLMNQRDHRKVCVVDDNVAWCGSFNISGDHLDSVIPWRDYGVRLTGSPVCNLVDNFDSVWFRREAAGLSNRLRYFRSNSSIRLRRLSNRLLVYRIGQAKHRVWICSAYFSPSGAVIRAIKNAKHQGVDVKLIVADRSDVVLFPLLSSTYYADLLSLGMSIYCYQAGMLHAKCMLVDDQCIMGSSNLNHRSFYHDLEVDVVLSSQNSIARLRSLLEEDIANSHQLNRFDASLWSGSVLFGWVLRVIRYWM